MNVTFIIIWCLFNHTLADYFLQGCLAELKQKKYWQENAPDNKYKYDYIAALVMHSISWTFLIMLPIAYYYSFNVDVHFAILFVMNTFLHCQIDDEKANKHTINLVVDQLLHMVQIAYTLFILL